VGFLEENNESTVVDCGGTRKPPVRSAVRQAATTAEMMDVQVYARNGWSGNPAWVLDSEGLPRSGLGGQSGQTIPPSLDWLTGSGTTADPYRIATVQQFLLGTASILWDKHFLLTADIDVTVPTYVPSVFRGMSFAAPSTGATIVSRISA
jgi:hypothetical protein